MSEERDQESWAIVELMGHVTMAGRLSEQERFGSKLGRLDVPTDDGGFTTVYFGGSSVYRVTAVSEAVARIKARDHQPRPVYAWEIPPAPSRASLVAPDDEDEEDDEDDIEGMF